MIIIILQRSVTNFIIPITPLQPLYNFIFDNDVGHAAEKRMGKSRNCLKAFAEDLIAFSNRTKKDKDVEIVKGCIIQENQQSKNKLGH